MMTAHKIREFPTVLVVLAATTAVALVWLAANLDRLNTPDRHRSQVLVGPAFSAPAAQAPMMGITPAPVIDPAATYFTETGDGRNDAWELGYRSARCRSETQASSD